MTKNSYQNNKNVFYMSTPLEKGKVLTRNKNNKYNTIMIIIVLHFSFSVYMYFTFAWTLEGVLSDLEE